MLIGSNIPDFAQWPLTVRTEERDKGSELVPTCLQLAPLLQIFILNTSLVKQLLGCHITVLHTEAALIHTPERNTRDGVVQTSRHLSTHILPAGADITTPGRCREALLASETATGKQEHARLIHLTLPYRALSMIDGICIHGAVGIEIFCRGT